MTIQGVARRLELLPKTAAEAREANAYRPGTNSQLRRELDDLDEYRVRVIDYGMNIARLRLVAAEDHLATLGVGFAHDQIIYGNYSTARACIEISARAWWLLEPDIDGETRTLRCLTDRFYSDGQMLLASPEGRTAHVRATITERHDEAVAAGVELLRAPHGTYRTTAARPSGVDLLRAIFDPVTDTEAGEVHLGEMLYRVLSAYIHGTDYALRQMLHGQGPADEDGLVPTVIGTNLNLEVAVIMSTLVPYINAADAEYRINDWRHERYASLLQMLRATLEKLVG